MTLEVIIYPEALVVLVKRTQFPMTLTYAFTDYRSQGQTIPRVIVDIATPPGPRNSINKLSLFNVYVALSRSSGRETIRLLRDLNEDMFQRPHDQDLLNEADRVRNLDTRRGQSDGGREIVECGRRWDCLIEL